MSLITNNNTPADQATVSVSNIINNSSISKNISPIQTLPVQTLSIPSQLSNTPADLPSIADEKTITPIYIPRNLLSIDFGAEMEKITKQILQTVEHTLQENDKKNTTRQFKTSFLELKARDVSDGQILCNTVRNKDFEYLEFIINDEAIKKRVDVNAFDDNGRSAIHYAVEQGDVKYVDLLISNKANPNLLEENAKKKAPLHIAVIKNDLEMVKCLVKWKANIHIEVTDETRWTPLHFAAQNGYEEILRFLLDSGGCINQVTMIFNHTPLFTASLNNRTNIVSLLLERDADLSMASSSGRTPLTIAREKGNDTIVKMLDDHLKTGKPPLQTNQKINYKDLLEPFKSKEKDSIDLIEAATSGHLHKVIGLVQRGANVNYQTDTLAPALHWATCNGYIKIVEFLIGNGADVNLKDRTNGKTPLHYSCANRNLTEITKLLLSKNPKVNVYSKKEPCTPLSLAVNNNDEETVKILIAAGAHPNIMGMTGETPYSTAMAKNLTAIVNILTPHVEKGFFVAADSFEDFLEPSKFYYDDFSNLGKAVEAGQLLKVVGYVKRLITEKKQEFLDKYISSSSSNNVPPLSLAIIKGFNQIAEYLIQNGVRINIRCYNGFTPMHYAVAYSNLEMIQRLLDKKANLNKPTKVKCVTPLHHAAENNRPKSLQMLLDKGADPRIITVAGETALSIAKENNFAECVKILEDHNLKHPQTAPLVDVSDTIDPLGNESDEYRYSLKNAIRRGDWGEVVLYINAKNSFVKDITNKEIQNADNNNFVKIVLYLLENGAKYSTDEYGDINALHYTAIKNLPYEFKRLLDAGMDPYKKTGGFFTLKKKCKTVREIAEEKQFGDILDVLYEYEKAKAIATNSSKKLKKSELSEVFHEDEIPLLDAAESISVREKETKTRKKEIKAEPLVPVYIDKINTKSLL